MADPYPDPLQGKMARHFSKVLSEHHAKTGQNCDLRPLQSVYSQVPTEKCEDTRLLRRWLSMEHVSPAIRFLYFFYYF